MSGMLRSLRLIVSVVIYCAIAAFVIDRVALRIGYIEPENYVPYGAPVAPLDIIAPALFMLYHGVKEAVQRYRTSRPIPAAAPVINARMAPAGAMAPQQRTSTSLGGGVRTCSACGELTTQVTGVCVLCAP